MGSFTTFKQARAYLVDCWAGLRIERPSIQINCGGAIYDKRDSRKRVFLIGAQYLTDEGTDDKFA